MPCDLGYRSVARTRVEQRSPTTVETRTRGQRIDAELMQRLGVEDPVFAAWVEELEVDPLLEKALERALEAMGPGSSVELRIEDGVLVGRAKALGPEEVAETDRAIERVGRRWQIEILRLVGEILDFELTLETVYQDGREVFVLEGEKTTSGDVKEFLRVTLDVAAGADIRLEHFKSPSDLAAEEDRFAALAERLGVRLIVLKRTREGQDIPKGAVHRHSHKGKGKA